MRERDIERRLRKGVEDLGGLCWKLTSPANRGVPDRLIIIPGYVMFVEVKAPNGRLSALQEFVGEKLRELYQDWRVIYNLDDVEELLDDLRRKIERH